MSDPRTGTETGLVGSGVATRSGPDVIEQVTYRADVVVTGGRQGVARSTDGLLEVELGRPGSRHGTNPEQLLAAGWGACFLSTMAALARKRGLTLGEPRIDVQVSLGTTAEGVYAIAAELVVAVPDLDETDARTLMAEAHGRCPYSRALSSSIEVVLRLGHEGGG